MESPLSRRQFLGVGGAAVALSIAGCSSNDEGEVTTHEVTVVAELDEAEFEAAKEEARSTQQQAQQDLEDGKIDREEAQRIYDEARTDLEETQRELLSDAVLAIQTHAETVDGLTITDSQQESGLALVEGTGDALVELLALDEVQAVLEDEKYGDI